MKKFILMTMICSMSMFGIVNAQQAALASPSAMTPQTTATTTITDTESTEESGLTKKQLRDIKNDSKELSDQAKDNGDPVVIYVSSGVVLVLLIILLIVLL